MGTRGNEYGLPGRVHAERTRATACEANIRDSEKFDGAELNGAMLDGGASIARLCRRTGSNPQGIRCEEDIMLEAVSTVGGVLLGTTIWLWILRRYDRVEPESIRHLLQVGLVGGGGSIAVAVLFNELIRLGLGLDMDIFEDATNVSLVRLSVFCASVGLIEEAAKAVATVHTTRRLGDLDEPVDAMVYAMTVALGFAALENVFYAMRFGSDVLFARFLWPVPAHMAYAALWGYGLAYARFARPDQARWVIMAPSVLMAAAFHAGANYLLFLQETVPAAISLLILAALAVVADVRLRKLAAESPFLQPGECVHCRYVNDPHALVCVRCGEALIETELFVTCPCDRSRIPARAVHCPVCGAASAPGIFTH